MLFLTRWRRGGVLLRSLVDPGEQVGEAARRRLTEPRRRLAAAGGGAAAWGAAGAGGQVPAGVAAAARGGAGGGVGGAGRPAWPAGAGKASICSAWARGLIARPIRMSCTVSSRPKRWRSRLASWSASSEWPPRSKKSESASMSPPSRSRQSIDHLAEHRRQGRGGGGRQGDQRGLAGGAAGLADQDVLHRQLDAEALAQPVGELEGQQRMAAEVEEVRIGADVAAEQVAPHLEDPFERRRGRVPGDFRSRWRGRGERRGERSFLGRRRHGDAGGFGLASGATGPFLDEAAAAVEGIGRQHHLAAAAAGPEGAIVQRRAERPQLAGGGEQRGEIAAGLAGVRQRGQDLLFRQAAAARVAAGERRQGAARADLEQDRLFVFEEMLQGVAEEHRPPQVVGPGVRALRLAGRDPVAGGIRQVGDPGAAGAAFSTSSASGARIGSMQRE